MARIDFSLSLLVERRLLNETAPVHLSVRLCSPRHLSGLIVGSIFYGLDLDDANAKFGVSLVHAGTFVGCCIRYGVY